VVGELHRQVFAIRPPFRVECDAIPYLLSRPSCLSNARRIARSPCTCHSSARPWHPPQQSARKAGAHVEMSLFKREHSQTQKATNGLGRASTVQGGGRRVVRCRATDGHPCRHVNVTVKRPGGRDSWLDRDKYFGGKLLTGERLYLPAETTATVQDSSLMKAAVCVRKQSEPDCVWTKRRIVGREAS
jgi:hypothetical protein